MEQANSNTSKSLNDSSGFDEQTEDTQKDFTTSYALILIALVIIVGNCLVILTVKSFGRRLVADIFIFCLAVLDLTHTLTSVLLALVFKFTMLRKATGEKNRTIFRILCQTQAWFTVTIQVQSAFIVTLITLERFVAVSRPFFYKSNVNTSIAIKILVFLFVVSVLLSSAPLLGWDEYVAFPKLALCLFRYDSSYAILMVVIGYADLALISYCFLAIRVSLRKFMRRQAYFAGRRGAISGPQLVGKENNLSTMSKDAAQSIGQSRRLIKVSAMVSFLFYFSWLPLMIGITLAQINKRTNDVISLIATLLPLTSPLVNPLIYFFSWERYKRSYIKIVKRFMNCWPYRRSIESKDLTKVPGPNSTIRNLVRNSGLLGRLDLTECRDDRDMCSDDVSTPGPLATQELFLVEITGSHSGNGLDHLGNTHSESSGKLRRYSDDEPKYPRRYTTAGCIQIACSESFLDTCSSQKEAKRRHTIGEFSEETVGSSEWYTGSTNEQVCRERCMTGSDEEISHKCEKCTTQHKNMEGKLALKELVEKSEFYQGGTSRDMRHLKTVNHREPRPWYKTGRKSGEVWDQKMDCEVCDSHCHEGTEEAPKRNEKSSENPSKSSATESCPITQRIHEYLTSVVDDEEWQDSRKEMEDSRKETEDSRKETEDSREKREDSRKEWENSRKERENSRKEWEESRKTWKYSRKEWKYYVREVTISEDLRKIFPEKNRVEDEENFRGKVNFGNKSSTATNQGGAERKRRVTSSSLRHKYRHHHDKKRMKSRAKNSESLRKASPRDCKARWSPGFSNCSQKTKTFSGNHRKQLRDTVIRPDLVQIAKEKDTSIWTYL